MKELNEVPAGWHSKNRICNIPVAHGIRVFRSENRGGNGLFGLIEYRISIDNIETLIPQSFFEAMAERYSSRYYVEYLYLDENCETYRVYESREGIFSER